MSKSKNEEFSVARRSLVTKRTKVATALGSQGRSRLTGQADGAIKFATTSHDSQCEEIILVLIQSTVTGNHSGGGSKQTSAPLQAGFLLRVIVSVLGMGTVHTKHGFARILLAKQTQFQFH